jgi:Xaa-Pro aminopeptidase
MNSGSNTNNEKGVEVRTHDIPVADAMTEFMKEGWAPSLLTGITAHPSIPYTTLGRDNLAKLIYFKFRINAQPKLR